MDKLSLAIHQYEKLTKQSVFSIRPLDDEHPEIFLINYNVVMRTGDPLSSELIFAKGYNEYYFYQDAVAKHLPLPCPNILFFIPRNNLKCEQYLDGYLLPDHPNQTEVFAFIDAITSLHRHCIEKTVFDPFEHFYHYKKLTPNPLPSSFEDDIVRKMRMIRDSSPLVLSHNDVKRRHIIFHEGNACLIDFKCVGQNAPIFDLASFFLEADLSPDLIRSCMERYNKAMGGRVYLYQEILDAITFLCFYDYYHYAALAKTSSRPLFREEAKRKKEKCLRLFEESLR